MPEVTAAPDAGTSLTKSKRRSPNWPNPQRLPYLPGLDGVRALAVAAVLLFHLPARVLPGGFLGVDAFFVLSGFLITTLLLEEVERRGGLGFKQFYLRRARRLLPALFVVLIFTAVLCLTVARDAASQFRQDLLSALTYTTNWWYIFDDRSYFEAIGRPPMLQHLWSLALEEQFYLIWPAVLLFAWRRWGRRGVGIAALIGAVGSTLWMATLASIEHVPTVTDTARVYFGSDTHAMTVMMGAALAVVWRPARLPTSVPRPAQIFLTSFGVVTLAVMAWFFIGIHESSWWLYRGGFLVFAVVTAGLVLVASHPASKFANGLGNPVMRWVGTRSYGIYLWHWPVFLVTRPTLDLGYSGWLAAITSLALTGVLAEACYRWVEMPVRRGALTASWRRLRAGDLITRNRWLGIGTASAATLLVGGIALAAVPAVDSTDLTGGVTSIGGGDLAPRKHGVKKDEHHHHPPLPIAQRRISVVGDSVVLSARNAILERLPNAHFDAVVARQPYETFDRIRERMRFDRLSKLMVLQTGTNGIPSREGLRELLVDLSDLDGIVVVNVRAQVPWMDQSNAVIDKATEGLTNVTVVNWAGLSKDRGGYFVADGTHLTLSGAAAYARAVVRGLHDVVKQTSEATSSS